eukprot:gene13450-biopygen6548
MEQNAQPGSPGLAGQRAGGSISGAGNGSPRQRPPPREGPQRGLATPWLQTHPSLDRQDPVVPPPPARGRVREPPLRRVRAAVQYGIWELAERCPWESWSREGVEEKLAGSGRSGTRPQRSRK